MSVENQNREAAIRLSGVKKMYQLGQVGGGTLQGDLQSWWARVRGREDPNTKIGTDQRLWGKTFMALNGIDLTVYKGEALGIIGGNGAGKSTMLKLLSRVTAPTEGEIDIYGRVASLLEVGTGFNGEMTGRENIYLNGAILGMTKAEIDAKLEDIIAFSEVRAFIDTPVKRYSSGMYVKLAFSVAAHLDSEILIMDEVLAVGDMAFQKKCLDKMRDAVKKEGRTVLYVSHNMNTIRQLCDRCVVLDQGKILFHGPVEEAIDVYIGTKNLSQPVVDLSRAEREKWFADCPAKMTRLEITNHHNGIFTLNAQIEAKMTIWSSIDVSDGILGVFLLNQGVAVTSAKSQPILRLVKNDTTEISFHIDLARLAPAIYTLKLVLSRQNEFGGVTYLDVVMESYLFEIVQPEGYMHNRKWNVRNHGYLLGQDVEIVQDGSGREDKIKTSIPNLR